MQEFSEKFRNFSSMFGEKVAEDSLLYTRERDRIDDQYSRPQNSKAVTPGTMLKTEIHDAHVAVNFENLGLSISIPIDNCFRITWKTNEIETLINKDFNLIKPEQGKNVRIGDEEVAISCSGSRIIVHKDGRISLLGSDGSLLRTDSAPEISDDEIATRTTIREASSIHGFGEKALGFNLRGTRMELWNHDPDGSYGPGDDPLYIGIPVYMDLLNAEGYLAFYNNPSKSHADVCSSEKNQVSLIFSGGGLDYFLCTGSMQKLASMFSDITGKPFMPPMWSLGFHQSRYSYMSTEEISDLAGNFLAKDLPISAIHMDIDHMDGYRVFTFDKQRFGDVKSLSEYLEKNGIKLVSIIDPGIKSDPGYSTYIEGERGGYFAQTPDGRPVLAPVWPGLAAFPDFTNERVRKWWADNYDFYVESGISGFWHDMNEPATFTMWGDNTLPVSAEFEMGSHKLVHNLYALFMAKAAYEGLLTKLDGRKPFILTRSGWAGVQRYAFVWTGDSESTPEEMISTISTIINMGLSGIPYVGVDIGGFSGSPTKELYLRWFQIGSFLPFFRVHSGKNTEMREPWRFGDDFLSTARKFLKLRYRLMPYYYGLAYEAHEKGYPIIRSPVWIDPFFEDDGHNSFLAGNSVMVIPVRPGQTRISCNLPSGSWYSLWDDTVYRGKFESETREDSIPVLVSEGSMIPMEEEGRIVVHVFPGDHGSGTLYLDDDTIDPAYCRYDFSIEKAGNLYRISFSLKPGGFAPLEKIRFKVHGNPAWNFTGKSILKVIDGDTVDCGGDIGEFTFSQIQ